MIWRTLGLVLLITAAAYAQTINIVTVATDGSETAVSSVIGFGQVAPGDNRDVHVRLRNPGTSAAALTALSLGATPTAGFTLLGAPALPASIAAGAAIDFTARFSNATAGQYNTTLSVNTKSVLLFATSIVTALVSVAAPCTGPNASGAITLAGSSCAVTLTNPTAQAFPIAPVTLSGYAGLPAGYSNGVTLPASQSVTFTVSSGASTTGTLVAGLKTYSLTSAAGAVSGSGHLSISSVAADGTETPLGSTPAYDYGQIAAGDRFDAQFRAHNNGTSAVTITTLCAGPADATCPVTASAYFSVVNSPSPPYVVAPGNAVDFWVRFSAQTINTYTATLLVNSQAVSLKAAAVAAATLSVTSPCTGPDANGVISFGRTAQNAKVVCVIALKNPNAQDLTVPLSLTGAAFSGLLSNSVIIPASQSISLTITFTATSAAALSGTLMTGARSYTLSGTGFSAPVPRPSLTFDSTPFNSGEQHTLTIALPSTSAVTTTGTLTLTFKPQPIGVSDDTAVMFVATGNRKATFGVTAGSTVVTINGKSNIVFATGTTAGQITFSMDAGIYGFAGDPTTIVTLAPAPIGVSSASASRKTGEVDVSITGFDNTYTAGTMTFTFYDKTGSMIGQAISADFTSNFLKLYQNQTAGSAFVMGLGFSVTGDATLVASVDVSLKNAAGTVKAARLNFP
jgi:hypothetical protein